MIKKERQIPLKIRKLQKLLRRLPKIHPKRTQIEDELAKRMAGFKGEQSIDYYLSFLPSSNYFIFHGLRLPNEPHYFQLDTLIISPYFILILEVKNISGILYFDDKFNQLIRSINGNEEVFPDPISQVQRQQKQFQDLIQESKLAHFPIESLVVFSSPYSNLKTSSANPHRYRKVIHSGRLPFKFEDFEKKYKEEQITTKELRKLTQLTSRSTATNLLLSMNLQSEGATKGRVYFLPVNQE
jgi:hypothetical protein